jgi:hypothetical protein
VQRMQLDQIDVFSLESDTLAEEDDDEDSAPELDDELLGMGERRASVTPQARQDRQRGRG